MTKKELAEAKTLAENDDLQGVDCTILHGLYLPTFEYPVFTSIRVVAKQMKDFMQFNGEWDEAAISEFCSVAKNRIRIV